jgi:hypothetical protein
MFGLVACLFGAVWAAPLIRQSAQNRFWETEESHRQQLAQEERREINEVLGRLNSKRPASPWKKWIEGK